MADRKVDYLLIGGGLASANCARWLREEGAEGEVLLVGREPDPPYNRPECSKGYLRGEETREEPLFRPNDWWAEQSIELLTRTSVTGLDLQARTAKLSTKQEIAFEKALIATGANVRRLNVGGCDLEHIYYLRTLGNSDAIREGVADAERVVLIGGSFIACEVAASLTLMGKSCTVVMQEQATFERNFGQETGRFFQQLLESHGVVFHAADQLERFEGDGRVAKVITRNGLELQADAVVVGAGVMPDVQLAQKAGLEIGEKGGVRCSSRLESSTPGMFAAGDICEYDSVIHGMPIRIEHWDVAFNHGKTAALNMLGRDVAHDVVPYFYSVLGDWGELEYVGPAYQWNEEIVRGSMQDGSFTAWYLQDSAVKGALTFGRPDDLDAARRLIVGGMSWGSPIARRSATPTRTSPRSARRRPRGRPITCWRRAFLSSRAKRSTCCARPVCSTGRRSPCWRSSSTSTPSRCRGQLERRPGGTRLLADGLGQRDRKRARVALQRSRRPVDRHRPQQLRDPDRPHRRDHAVLRHQRRRVRQALARRPLSADPRPPQPLGDVDRPVARVRGRRAAATRGRGLPLVLLVVERRQLPRDRGVRLPDVLRGLLHGP